MSNKLNPKFPYILKWTRPGTSHTYYNHFTSAEKAHRRFIFLQDRQCGPEWVKHDSSSEPE